MSESPSVLDLGARGDGVTDNRSAILAAIAGSVGQRLLFPRGSYLVDTSTGPLSILNYSGEIEFEPGAELVFSSTAHTGLIFGDGTPGAGGSHIVIRNYRARHATTPTVRLTSEAALMFNYATDVEIVNATVLSSAGLGIWIARCTRVKIDGTYATGTMADGCHISNSSYVRVSNHYSTDTGDDGLSFVAYATGDAGGWNTATNVVVRNGKARGITVVGMSNVSISNFIVDGTSAQGIIAITDSATAGNVPTNVTFSNGTVRNAGGFGTAINPFGIWVFSPTPTDAIQATFSNIEIQNSGRDGVHIDANTAFDVTLNNVSVVNAAENGFAVLGGTVRGGGLRSIGVTGYGFYGANCALIELASLAILNAEGGGAPNRAFWLDSCTLAMVDGLLVSDDRNPPLGYVVGESGTASGVFSAHAHIPHGAISVQGSAGSRWTVDDVQQSQPGVQLTLQSLDPATGLKAGIALSHNQAGSQMPLAQIRAWMNDGSALHRSGGLRFFVANDGTVTPCGTASYTGRWRIGPNFGGEPTDTLEIQDATPTTGATKVTVSRGAAQTALDTILDGNGTADFAGYKIAGVPLVSLTNVGTPGTYTKVTTDAQGRVTVGTNPALPPTTQSVVTGSRALGTTYQNTGTTPMFVSASINVAAGSVTALSNSANPPTVAVASNANGSASGWAVALTFWVLPGNYYKVTGGTAVFLWAESQ